MGIKEAEAMRKVNAHMAAIHADPVFSIRSILEQLDYNWDDVTAEMEQIAHEVRVTAACQRITAFLTGAPPCNS